MMINARRFQVVILALGMTGLVGCTSSQPLPPEGDEAGAPVETAALPPTDMAPLDSAELPPAPSDLPELPSDQVAAMPTEEALPPQEAAPEIAQEQPAVEAPALTEEQAVVAAAPPVEQPQASGDAGTYTVGRNDTLMKIAYEVYGDLYQWKKLYQDNHDRIRDPNNLIVGTQLVVYPGSASGADGAGEKVRIKQGDTLGSLAQEVYGTPRKWRRLWEHNKQLIRDPNRIYAGFYLFYEMSPQDTQELEQFRMASGQEGTPQASMQTTVPSMRNPASAKAEVYGPPAPAGYRTLSARHR